MNTPAKRLRHYTLALAFVCKVTDTFVLLPKGIIIFGENRIIR